MSAPKYTTSSGYAGFAFVLMARYVDLAGDDIEQAGVSSVTVDVWPKSNPKAVQTSSFNAADVVFDTLQTGSGWNTQAWPQGFNLKVPLPGTLFPKEEETYRIFLRVVPSSGNEAAPIVHDHTTHAKTGG